MIQHFIVSTLPMCRLLSCVVHVSKYKRLVHVRARDSCSVWPWKLYISLFISILMPRELLLTIQFSAILFYDSRSRIYLLCILFFGTKFALRSPEMFTSNSSSTVLTFKTHVSLITILLIDFLSHLLQSTHLFDSAICACIYPSATSECGCG